LAALVFAGKETVKDADVVPDCWPVGRVKQVHELETEAVQASVPVTVR
jgi:hypothetical protein